MGDDPEQLETYVDALVKRADARPGPKADELATAALAIVDDAWARLDALTDDDDKLVAAHLLLSRRSTSLAPAGAATARLMATSSLLSALSWSTDRRPTAPPFPRPPLDGIDIVTTVDGITAADLDGGFFEGWVAKPDPEQHLELLRNSAHVALARTVDGGRIVGFATAISDGVLAAYIPLVEVLPEYRGQEVGARLVRALLTALTPLYMVDVMFDDDDRLRRFYGRFGFVPATGGSIRNHLWNVDPDALEDD